MPAIRRSRSLVSSGSGNQPGATISFSMLLNLAAVANSKDPSVLWGFIRRYAPDVRRRTIRASISSCGGRCAHF